MDLREFLEKFSAETVSDLTVDQLNTRNEAGRTPLVRFVAEGNSLAVEALLKDGRCDWSIPDAEGKTVWELADRKVKKLLKRYSPPDFFYRNGEVVPESEVMKRIEDGTLAPDEALFNALPDAFTRALLTGEGKISKADFEKWMELDKYPGSLYWEAQIGLLMTDEEYGRKFADWEYIRSAAEPDEWLWFLRDLPQYAAEADWEKLNRDGSEESWQKLLEVRPELAKYRQKPEMTLDEFELAVYRYLIDTLHVAVRVADRLMLEYEEAFPGFLDDGYTVAMAATYMAHNY